MEAEGNEAPLEPQQRAWYSYQSAAPGGVSYLLATVIETPVPGSSVYVIMTAVDPGPTLAYRRDLSPYDGDHDGDAVVVELHDHDTLAPGIYPAVIVTPSRPGNTEFYVQLTDHEDLPPFILPLADITFVE